MSVHIVSPNFFWILDFDIIITPDNPQLFPFFNVAQQYSSKNLCAYIFVQLNE